MTTMKQQTDPLVVRGYLEDYPHKVGYINAKHLNIDAPLREQVEMFTEASAAPLLETVKGVEQIFNDFVWFTEEFPEEKLREDMRIQAGKACRAILTMCELSFREGFRMASETEPDPSSDSGYRQIWRTENEAWVNSEAEDMCKEFGNED